jgi:hypothetical protein
MKLLFGFGISCFEKLENRTRTFAGWCPTIPCTLHGTRGEVKTLSPLNAKRSFLKNMITKSNNKSGDFSKGVFSIDMFFFCSVRAKIKVKLKVKEPPEKVHVSEAYEERTPWPACLYYSVLF